MVSCFTPAPPATFVKDCRPTGTSSLTRLPAKLCALWQRSIARPTRPVPTCLLPAGWKTSGSVCTVRDSIRSTCIRRPICSLDHQVLRIGRSSSGLILLQRLMTGKSLECMELLGVGSQCVRYGPSSAWFGGDFSRTPLCVACLADGRMGPPPGRFELNLKGVFGRDAGRVARKLAEFWVADSAALPYRLAGKSGEIISRCKDSFLRELLDRDRRALLRFHRGAACRNRMFRKVARIPRKQFIDQARLDDFMTIPLG